MKIIADLIDFAAAAAADDIASNPDNRADGFDLTFARRHMTIGEIIACPDIADGVDHTSHPRLARALEAALMRELRFRSVTVL